jgi:AcrR family transcriptional regulator
VPKANHSRNEKRARILEAALTLCERSGIEGARMDEVAALAQVSKGTLYNFFESKEDLFLATLIDSYQGSLVLFDAGARAPADPRARLVGMLDGMAKILASLAPRMTVHYQAWGLVAKHPRYKERLYDFLRSFHADRAASLEQTIRAGQQAGSLRADSDAPALAEAIMALLSGFLYCATFDPDRASPAQLRACFDVLLRDALLPAAAGGGSDA